MREHADKSPSLQALNWLNFFLADVATGIGPFLAAFLSGRDGWNATRIGLALSAASIAGLLVQTPLGIWVDKTVYKRGLLAVAVVLIMVGSIALTLDAGLASVITVQTVYGVAGAAIAPALAAITLGLVGAKAFARTQGRVQAWNHAGNVAAALAIGAIGKFYGFNGALWFLVALGIAALLALRGVRDADIDHRAARGANADDSSPLPWYAPLANSNLRALVAAFFLFHFANAAMLPLAGMKLAGHDAASAAPYMSACVVGAQLVMVPVAALAGRFSDRYGWKHLLAFGFAVLIVRGILYPLSDSPIWIVGVQLLDGIGAGLFGVLSLVAVEELTSGSGRFNAAQGLATTFVGIGASVSTFAAGWVVDRFGYAVGFISLAAVGVAALAVLMIGVHPPRNAAAHAPATRR